MPLVYSAIKSDTHLLFLLIGFISQHHLLLAFLLQCRLSNGKLQSLALLILLVDCLHREEREKKSCLVFWQIAQL